MTVVTFEEYTPLPRYDGIPWTKATIQEATAADGAWLDLETVNLTPVDPDPANPSPRNFTTENAILSQGWYRIIFADANGDEQLPTAPIQNVQPVEVPYEPTVEEVANLIISRTVNTVGDEIMTFTGETRPTFQVVEEIIDQAVDDVTTMIDTDIPVSAYEYAKTVIALRAAMIIERSYFAEQINSNRSPYPYLKDDWDLYMGTAEHPGLLYKAIQREEQEDTTSGTGGYSKYWFPPAEPRIELGRPL